MSRTKDPAPADHPCGICGASPAPFGFRLPGVLSKLPHGRRGYLWSCQTHRQAAADRQARATTARPD